MRQIALILGLGTFVLMAGCTSTRWGFVKNGERTPASNATEPPSVEQLVDWMNKNENRITSLRIEDLDLTCTQGIKTLPSLRGMMVVEKPSNFRLGAKALGNPVVDIGSNKDEFWYWISKADPPYQVYCSYDDLKQGRVRRMPFPFQPEWVMETMGLGPYSAKNYKLESDDRTLKLIEKTTSPQGTPVRKVIVFKRTPVQYPQAQVTDFLLLDDATGKEMCSAHITEVQEVGSERALIPRRLELRWPAEKLTLTMRLNEVTVNPQVHPPTFTRQIMRDIQPFNLARMQVDTTPPPQATTGVMAPRTDANVTPTRALAQ